MLVCGGSVNYIGAMYLACEAALRVGAGLVTLATPISLQPILASKLTEATYAPLPESELGVVAAEAAEALQPFLASADVLLLGCGLGQSAAASSFIEALLLGPAQASPPRSGRRRPQPAGPDSALVAEDCPAMLYSLHTRGRCPDSPGCP